MVCKIEGCGRALFAAQLCSVHYNRQRKTGTTDPGPKARRPFADRLWARIERRGADECWPWMGHRTRDGRGQISLGGRGGKRMLAHRAVWEETHGPIPIDGTWHGRVIMHTCDNGWCCNPAHLRLGTQADNVRDMDTKGRRVSTPHIGEKHPGAKHTRAQAEAVHQALKEDSGYGACPRIAKRLGVDVTFVRNIKKGLIWQETRTI